MIKMGKVSSWFILLAIYIFYFIGAASEEVGKTLQETIVSFWFPFQLAVFLIVPAFLGYLAGIEQGD